MKTSTKLLLTLFVLIVYALHQDFWNLKNTNLVLGFLPAGLAYHAGYSVLAAITMAILVKFAWPKHLENVQPEPGVENKPKDDSH